MIDDDDDNKPGTAAEWLSEISEAIKMRADYDSLCRKINDIYVGKGGKGKKYNILWSNQEILRPSVYERRPKPVVHQRQSTQLFGDVGRVAGMMMEYAIEYQLDASDFDGAIKNARNDYLLYGAGIVRLRYKPVVKAEPDDGQGQPEPIETERQEGGNEGFSESAEEQSAPQEVLASEHVVCDFVHREDFIHPPCRSWEEVPWIAYRSFLTRDELIDRFGKKIGKRISLDVDADNSKSLSKQEKDARKGKAVVYEIWDKSERWVTWVSPGYPDTLDDCAPYLVFKDFYPSPRPAYGTLSTDSLVPVPDYVLYRDQAETIDALTARIGNLEQQVKCILFYPLGLDGESTPEISKALKPGIENIAIGVKNWAQFSTGGSGPPVFPLPIKHVVEALQVCKELRDQMVKDCYQITGISDIMRGDTDPDETATAQGKKSQWGSVRLRDRQKEMQRLCRDVVRMTGEIIASQFQFDTIALSSGMKLPTDMEVQQLQQQYQIMAQTAQMQGQQPPPPPDDPGPTQEQIMSLLRDKMLECYALDIETDSTIAMDEVADRRARSEFLESISRFVVGWLPVISQQPAMADLAGKLMIFGVRGFPVARELEDVIEKAVSTITQSANQPRGPDPKTMAYQQKAQAEIGKAKIGLQATQMKAQAEIQKATIEAQAAQHAHHMDMQAMQTQAHLDHAKAQNEFAKIVQQKEERAVANAAVNGMGLRNS